METAEPVSYEFPGHGVGSFSHRRTMDSPLFPYYSHPTTTSYSLPYQTPYSSSTTPYNFGPLSHHNSHHQYFVANQPPPLNSSRLSDHHPPPLPEIRPASCLSDPHHPPHHHHPPTSLASSSLPEIRPAKNAISQVCKSEPDASQGQQKGSNDGEKKDGPSTEFSTEVDVLMKAIQAKPSNSSSPIQQQSLPSLQQLAPPGYPPNPTPSYSMSPPQALLTHEGQLSRSGKKRKYTCTLPNCGKSFAQKTHLDIHTRAHTGDKPFVCKEPSCGQRFSQLGNLKTHQRRHTGEKPYECDLCHKRFAQRGNVRAHKTTHLEAKPFTCLLDDCGKNFTQLGNLKSHQNKFHSTTLRTLTHRFTTISEQGPANPGDRELWEYFATLYKNSNKGIKGRGKDRRISTKRLIKGETRSLSHSQSHAQSLASTLANGNNPLAIKRPPSMESDVSSGQLSAAQLHSQLQSQIQMRRGSFEDGFSVYTRGSSSDVDEGGYFYERR